MVILAVPFLRERLTPYRLAAVALGFAGILIILRPGIAIIDPAALVVLLGAVLFGGANVFTKALTRAEGAMTILFWMFFLQLLMAGAAVSTAGIYLPHGHYWLWVVAIGLTGLAAHYCTARSLSLADAGLVTPFHYLRVPLIAWLAGAPRDRLTPLRDGLHAGCAVANGQQPNREGPIAAAFTFCQAVKPRLSV